MSPRKTYTIGIIVFDGVLTSEVTGPAEVFGMASKQEWFAGSKVLLIGIDTKQTIRTEEGLRLTVDTTIKTDVALDVLIVPGANDVSKLLTNKKLNTFIKKHEQTAQWVGSVCAGAFVLGQAGILNGKKATTYAGGENDLQSQFPKIQVISDKPIVFDKRLITANEGLVSYRAALILLGKLTSSEHSETIYKNLAIDRIGTWDEIKHSILKDN